MEESRVLKHLKPPLCGEASRNPRALSQVRTQVIDALVHDFHPLRAFYFVRILFILIRFETIPFQRKFVNPLILHISISNETFMTYDIRRLPFSLLQTPHDEKICVKSLNLIRPSLGAEFFRVIRLTVVSFGFS